MRNFLIFLGNVMFLFLLFTNVFSQTDLDIDSSFMAIPSIYKLTHLPPLKLDKKLTGVSEANKLLEETQLIFEQIEEVKGMEKHSINIDSLYVENIENLIKLIQEYPNSKTALTAKLTLGLLVFQISYIPEVLDVAGNLFDEIITEFPNTWQGKYALWGKAEYLASMEKYNESIIQINTHLEEIISLDNIQDSDFTWVRQNILENEKDKLDAFIRELLIFNYCRLEEYENAQKECEYIIQNYPNFYNIDSWKRFLDMIKQHESPFGVIRNGKVVYE